MDFHVTRVISSSLMDFFPHTDRRGHPRDQIHAHPSSSAWWVELLRDSSDSMLPYSSVGGKPWFCRECPLLDLGMAWYG